MQPQHLNPNTKCPDFGIVQISDVQISDIHCIQLSVKNLSEYDKPKPKFRQKNRRIAIKLGQII